MKPEQVIPGLDDNDPATKMALREIRLVIGAMLIDDERNRANPDRAQSEKRRCGTLKAFGYYDMTEPIITQAATAMKQLANQGVDPHAHFLAEKGEARAALFSGEATQWKRFRDDAKNKRPVKIGPNDRCPCGSGKKYKKCCRSRLEGRK